ncbi:hypothetical protein LAZ67_22000567 [Cordylochernes scorpioides]|uniref:HTH CENPB-type domain-containing protein n=1 Tax=Cordylochernes scorpioides TaxID=51811 RepID=A0ABY6LN96_9ARAC|nr:hypothetical protein LAZ67_22000567 [Cordylochernes scorpioides]
MASKEERQKRGKYRILKLGEKLDVLSDIKKGLSYTTIMQKYKISKTTVYDIKKSELKLTKFVDSTEKDVKKFSQVKNPLYENDKAVNIWYESQRLSGVPIRGIELQTAASHFASKLNNPTFKASGGWLSRYRARHNLKNKKVVGEALSADEDAVEAVLSEKMEISSSDDSSSTSEDSLEPDVPRCEALKSLDVALKYLEKRTEPIARGFTRVKRHQTLFAVDTTDCVNSQQTIFLLVPGTYAVASPFANVNTTTLLSYHEFPKV